MLKSCTQEVIVGHFQCRHVKLYLACRGWQLIADTHLQQKIGNITGKLLTKMVGDVIWSSNNADVFMFSTHNYRTSMLTTSWGLFVKDILYIRWTVVLELIASICCNKRQMHSVRQSLVQWHDPTFLKKLVWYINNHFFAFFNSS